MCLYIATIKEKFLEFEIEQGCVHERLQKAKGKGNDIIITLRIKMIALNHEESATNVIREQYLCML